MFPWWALGYLQIHGWFTGVKLNMMSFAITINFGNHLRGQGVHNRWTYTVKTGRNLIATITEFTTGMEDG